MEGTDANTPAAAPSPAATVEVPRDPQAYAEWRNTGKLPEPPKPKTEESASSKKSSDAKPGKGEAEGTGESRQATDSETGKKQEHKPSGAEKRLNEILEDLRRAGLSPAELKTFKREAQKAAEQPNPTEKTEKPAGTEPPKKPKLDDFDDYDAYETAKDKYYEDLADYKAQQRLETFRTEQQQEAQQREFHGKLSDATKRYGDDAVSTINTTAKAIFGDAKIPAAIKAIVDQSPVLVDLLYVMGSKGEDFTEFLELARTNPGAAIRKAVLLERLVTDELAKGSDSGAGRDDSGKFTKQAPEKKVTEAPPPPKEVSGRGSQPTDEVETAAKTGDFAAFRAAGNRRDIARRKGQ